MSHFLLGVMGWANLEKVCTESLERTKHSSVSWIPRYEGSRRGSAHYDGVVPGYFRRL